MKIAVYSAHDFEIESLQKANVKKYELVFIKETLTPKSIHLSKGCNGIAIFTSDDASANILYALKDMGISFIVTRSTGFDHIDISVADELEIRVANVPGYSPNAIAEHAVAMMLALSRKLVLADQQVKEHNFTLDNLIGFNLNGKTVGIIGTGKIGATAIKILKGFGCYILAYDIKEDNQLVEDYDLEYVSLDALFKQSDIISIHAPLNKDTAYLINSQSIRLMKDGVMLINTSRGKIVNTLEVLHALQSGKIGYFGMDVYENEKEIFFKNLKDKAFTDELIKDLMKLPNVLITAHQGFLTSEALNNIATTTLLNIDCFANKKVNTNALNKKIGKIVQLEVY